MPVEVFPDLATQSFVASIKGGTKTAPISNPFHQDKLYLKIQPLFLAPIGAQTSQAYTVVDASTYAITALLVKRSDGSTLAGPSTFSTTDETAKVGSLDLNTAAMVTAFTSGSTVEVAASLIFQFDDGANHKVTISSDVTVKRSYLTSGTPSELPATSYLTRDECIALFVKFAGNPNGASITLPDSTGTYETIIKCNDDGSNASNVG